MKKYELTDDFIEVGIQKIKLYRIKALIDIPSIGVKAGDSGGYIEIESNLDQEDHSWVFGNAQVYGDACVYGNARVFGNAQVYSDACVYGNARVFGNAQVYSDARVSGNAQVFGNAQVYGDACVDSEKSLVWFSKVGRENGTLTVYKSKTGELLASRGCFSGTVEEFLRESAKVHDEKIKREYELLIEVARSRILG
ncbi:polymer-forming cytoskeletal protein [Mannheimia sp. AT1]|uniref:Polymer-forming cytoskeletal protein n=1 Tax=Mannheimia cairinae TaxID=3025936 RepID=A0ABT5MSP5_9PAST|nr:polymer-forming cytoskeletal protein [Mannheimia cairinae]MDD0824621.1 polymer-forming cytoskeletal protein [Mannheimia cairinae]MDD0826450.1 polymer-forming cytoskeletal protein [Mannheimia cairinae]